MADVYNYDFESYTAGNAMTTTERDALSDTDGWAGGSAPNWAAGLNGSSTSLECTTTQYMWFPVTGDFSAEVRVRYETLPTTSASRTMIVLSGAYNGSWITGIRWKSDYDIHVLQQTAATEAWSNGFSAGDEGTTEWIVQFQHDDTNHTGHWRVLDSARRVLYTFNQISYTQTGAVAGFRFMVSNNDGSVVRYDNLRVTDQLEWITPDTGAYVVVNDSERPSDSVNVVIGGTEQPAVSISA